MTQRTSRRIWYWRRSDLSRSRGEDITYRLSYRDLVEMMAERGIIISHSTILRWVQHYVPEFERRWSRHAKPVHPSWRMDETAVSVRGGTRYLYRAVDKYGKTVDSLLAHGIDPSALKAALGKHRFGVTMREWEAEQGRMHAGLYFCPVCGVSNPSIPKL